MSIAATVGVPVVTGMPACIHDGFVALERLRDVDQRFLLYTLKWLEPELQAAGQTGSQANVNTDIVESFEITLPPLPEQHVIAEVLSDADDLIGALKRQITKKEAIKQGLMQELLVGKTRLSGFESQWSEVTIGDLGRVDPETLNAKTPDTTLIDYISLEDVEQGRLLNTTRMRFVEAPSRARRVVRRGDVLFGTVRPGLRSHLLYKGNLRRPVASTGFAVVRALGDSSPAFLFYLLMSDLAMRQIERIIAGSNYPAVASRDVRRLSFSVPEHEEQRAIAQVLSDADAEIAVLYARLEKATAMKRGMMQGLLTGRIRLPVLDDIEREAAEASKPEEAAA